MIKFKRCLLNTEDNQLGADSADEFWGYKGENMLGKLLMEMREKLIKKATKKVEIIFDDSADQCMYTVEPFVVGIINTVDRW